MHTFNILLFKVNNALYYTIIQENNLYLLSGITINTTRFPRFTYDYKDTTSKTEGRVKNHLPNMI